MVSTSTLLAFSRFRFLPQVSCCWVVWQAWALCAAVKRKPDRLSDLKNSEKPALVAGFFVF